MLILGRWTALVVGRATEALILTALAAVVLTTNPAAPAAAHADPQLDAAICQYFDNQGGVNGDNLRVVGQFEVVLST